MKCIDELKKIGVEKIASKTRITQDKVRNILNLNYGAFNKTHARGFKQIIEREFSVDLSEWMEALEAHSAVQDEAQEAQKDTENNNIIIPVESTKKDKTYIILFALLAVLVAFFIALFAYNNFVAPKSQEGAESTLDSANAEEFTNEVDSAENTRDLAENALDSANISADSAPNDSNTKEAKNITIPAESSANEITITPNEPLWVGVIDLESRKKQQFSIAQKRTINLEGDKIIITGHSSFSIVAPNLNKELLGGNRAYFIYKAESGAREITRKEFIELNGGAEW